jgi:hypothetical protein
LKKLLSILFNHASALVSEAGIGLKNVEGIDPGERGQIQSLLSQTRHQRRKHHDETSFQELFFQPFT